MREILTDSLVDGCRPIFRLGNQILVDASIQFRFALAPRAPRQLDSPHFACAGARPFEFVCVKREINFLLRESASADGARAARERGDELRFESGPVFDFWSLHFGGYREKSLTNGLAPGL
jgi:hypothetical protein